MEDLFKKFVYTSVGLVSASVEKMQSTVAKLVDEDKISQDEGKKIVDDLLSTTESKRTEFEGKLKSVIEDVMTRMNFATQSQIQDLEARLAAAEAKLGTDGDAETPASKKKAPVKKAAPAAKA